MLLFQQLPLEVLEERVLLDLRHSSRPRAQTRLLVDVQQPRNDVHCVVGHRPGKGDLLEKDGVLGGRAHVRLGPEGGRHVHEGREVLLRERSVAGQQLEHGHAQRPPVYCIRVAHLLPAALRQHDHHLWRHVPASQYKAKRHIVGTTMGKCEYRWICKVA